MPISLLEFEDLLTSHDWFYSFSDDTEVYRKGQESYTKLREYASQSATHRDLFFTHWKTNFPNSTLAKESIKLI